MNPMTLYRLLQTLTGELNALVVGLYNGQVEAPDAQAQALAKIESAIKALKKED